MAPRVNRGVTSYWTPPDSRTPQVEPSAEKLRSATVASDGVVTRSEMSCSCDIDVIATPTPAPSRRRPVSTPPGVYETARLGIMTLRLTLVEYPTSSLPPCSEDAKSIPLGCHPMGVVIE